MTALMFAARGGYKEVCAVLADRGANLDATDRVSWWNERLISMLESCSLAHSRAVTVISLERQP